MPHHEDAEPVPFFHLQRTSVVVRSSGFNHRTDFFIGWNVKGQGWCGGFPIPEIEFFFHGQ